MAPPPPSTEKDSKCCLFVRNLTKDSTREELTQLFSADYVIKHAIIIHERHGGPSKGFGFVTFALPSDAEEAMSRDNFSLKGNKLKLAFAAAANDSINNKPVAEAAPTTATPAATSDPSVVDWKARKDERRKTPAQLELEKRTVVLFGVGQLSEAQLRKRLKKRAGGTVESISDFEGHGNNGNGDVKSVVYASANAVNGAVKEVNGRSWGGEDKIVYARRLAQVALTPHQRSKSRLICRNLAFGTTEQELRQEFAKLGPVDDVVVNAKGFGFVQFRCRSDAEKAVEQVNGTTTLGPKRANGKRGVVAVDFALTKDHYEKIKAKEEEQEEEEEEEEEEEVKEEEQEEEEEQDGSSSEEEEDGSGSEDEDASDASDDDEDDDDTSASAAPPTSAAAIHGDKGVRDRRTLFVRNLLFETTEDTIRERFREFGKVRGVKLCRDASQRSRGLAFVEFWDSEPCDKVLAGAAQSKTGASLLLEGRELYCNLAVDKHQAEGLRTTAAAGGADVKEDKRHLHLVKLSRVPVDQVPQADAKKREFQEQETRTKLKNPMFYVSQTRLSVKNLCRKPSETPDSRALRSVFKAAAIRGLKERLVIEPPPRTSVRALKATVFQEEGKQELPTGFGFVEMSTHAHALAALKVLNNSAEFAYLAAGGKQAMKLPEDKRPRLIVSFAIENGAKVRAQQERAQKSSSSSKEPGSNKRPRAEEEEGEGKEQKKTKKTKTKSSEDKPAKKVREHLATDKPKPASATAAVEEETKQEPFANRVQKNKKKPMTNKAFERGSNSARNTDGLDQIMHKRAKLFDEETGSGADAGGAAAKKRWFEE